ncbi:ABC transporter permease [Clostridium formicaceticum]|uniref:MacB-like periplasmic core domain protein n=1 Tax=Clostridium formicaceticum TaxID=1497 RepID=A0AAC9WIE5_9CLOT|nr:ABC transporter permease [Clostridium formicaceticum]AOY78029.1 hypothetical protein BJL90_20480 [Clostridium formicaceticum]ARE88665.1 MacB-like periplasmic core domain protein [Clostridium formicaceticum]
MNVRKIWKCFFFSGIFILLLSISFIQGINKNAEVLLGTFGFNKISVEAKENSIKRSTYGFTKDEVLKLEHKLKENLISFTLPFEVNIKNQSNAMSVRALAISSSYQSFADINLIGGSFLTEKQEMNKDRVLIIEEETALKLFKSTDIIGMNMELMDKNFTIIGVYKRRNSLLSNLLKKKESNIYIPLQAVFILDENIEIPYFQVAISDEGKGIQSPKAVIKVLEDIGKSSSNYKITDYRSFQKRIFQINKILIFIFGISIIYDATKTQIKALKRMFLTIRNSCSTQYFSEAMKSNRKVLIYLIMRFLFLTSCVYIILNSIKFDFYIPAVDSSYAIYSIDLFINNLLGIATSKTLFQCIPYLSELLIVLTSILGTVLGGLLLYIGFFFSKHIQQQLDKGLLFFSIGYLAVLLLSNVIMMIIHLPIVMDIKIVIAIYIFLVQRKFPAFDELKNIEGENPLSINNNL